MSAVSRIRVEGLGRAVTERSRARPPSEIGPVVVGAVVSVVAYMAVAVAIAPPSEPGQQFGEGMAVNALSATLLGASAGLSFACFLLRRREAGRHRWFWLMMAAGFLFLCLDEQLELHERIGSVLTHGPLGPTRVFRNWNDVVVLGYGAVAVVALASFLPEILRLPRFAELLAIGLVFYALHTGIDMVFAASSLKDIPEEGAKVLANTFFALAVLAATLALGRAAGRS